MANNQKTIVTRLKSLRELGDVTVTVSEGLGQIDITHRRHHVADFRFIWAVDHYIGHFVDPKGKKSQAIVSLWLPMEAVKFMVSYSTFVDLGAMRPKPVSPIK